MAIRCMNKGFIKPFGKNVVFFAEMPSDADVKSTMEKKTEEIKDDLSRLEESNKELMLRTMEAMAKVNKLDATSIEDIKQTIRYIDSLEAIAIVGSQTTTPEQAKANIDELFFGLEKKYNLTIPEVQAIRLAQKDVAEKVATLESNTLPAKIQYIKTSTGESITKANIGSEFGDGKTYKIDFGGDETAEDKVTLQQMLPTGISFVKITGADGKIRGWASTESKYGNDFRYYKVEKGFEKLMGKHASVLQGYTIETNYQGNTPTDTTTAAEKAQIDADAQSVLDEPVDEEVLARVNAKDEATELSSKIEREESGKETTAMFDAAKEFNVNYKIKLPEGIKHLSDEELGATFDDMGNGDDVTAALAKLDSTKAPEDLLRSIRSKNFASGGMVSLDEVSRAVRGQTHKEVYEEFTSLMGKPLSPQLKKQFEDLKKFMSASHQLLDALTKLTPKAASKEFKETNELSDTDKIKIEQMEAVAGTIWYDKADKGPEETRNFLQRLFAIKGDAITMQTLDKKGLMTNDIQQAASGESAYVQLVASAMKYNDDGQAVVDEGKFVKRLNELRKTGFENVGMSGNLKLIQKCENHKEELSKNITTDEVFTETADLGETSKELIRYGYTRELHLQRVTDLLNDKSPVETKILEGIIKSYPNLSAEDLKDTANIIEKEFITLAGLAIHREEVQDNRKFTNKPGKTVKTTVDGAIGTTFKTPIGEGMISISTTGDVTVGIASGGKIGDVSVYGGIGGSVGPEGVGGGTGFGITIPLSEIYKNGVAEHNLTVQGVAAAHLGPDYYIALGGAFGYKLDLNGTSQRLEKKLENNPILSAKIAAEKEAQRKALSEKYPKEVVDMMMKEVDAFVKQNIGNEAAKDMPDFAITEAQVGAGFKLSAGEGLTAGLAFGIKVAFKNGTDRIIYCVPHQPNGDAAAEQKLREQIEKETGEKGREIFIAGNLTINPDGGTTAISEAQFKTDELSAKNSELAEHGLQLTQLKLDDGSNRLRLRISRIDGDADVYIDRDSGIEAYPGPNGEAILNLEEAQQISVRRVDTKSPLRNQGGVLNTEIFISNNLYKKNDDIKKNSPNKLHFEADILKGQMTQAETISRFEGESTIYDSEQAAIDAKVHINDLYKDMEEVRLAGKNMSEVLGAVKYSVGIEAGRRGDLDRYAEEIVGKDEKLYKRLSVDMDAKAITDLVIQNENCKDLSPAEMTYMHQALMIASLANAPKTDEGFIQHVKDWNRDALERQLNDKKIPGAKGIATDIMDYYAKSIEDSLKNGSGLKESRIPRGSIVQIQVGTQKIEGYRQAFYQPNGAPEIIGAVDLTNQAMLDQVFGNDAKGKEQADTFVKAMTDRLSPLSDKPTELFKSQLGLSVLSASELIFGARDCKRLAYIIREQKGVVTEDFKDIYEKFEKLVHELRDNGKVVLPSGLILSVDTTKQMGFYEACKNFTMVMNEKLSITIPKIAATAEVQQYIEGDRTAKYEEVGGGFTIDVSKVVKPPHKHTPPPKKPPEEEVPEPEANKNPRAAITTDRPLIGSDTAADTDAPDGLE